MADQRLNSALDTPDMGVRGRMNVDSAAAYAYTTVRIEC